MFTIYDEAVMRFFEQIRWQGRPVPVVKSAADRAYAQVTDFLAQRSNSPQSQSVGEKPRPYPFVAFWPGLFNEEAEYNVPAEIRNIGADPEKDFSYAMRSPISVVSDVEVNLYFSSDDQYKFILYQIYNLFPQKLASILVDYTDEKWYKEHNVAFEFAKILGKQRLRFYKENQSDQSAIEDSGLGQKTHRLVLSCNLHGWIPFQPYAVPMMRYTEFQVLEETSGDELSTVVAPVNP